MTASCVQLWVFWWKALGVINLTAKRHLLETTAEERGIAKQMSLYLP